MTDQLTRPLVCPVLVGRAAERSALVGVLDGIASARGATVLLSGEAGIGKSRLARALAEEAAARGCRVLEARCYEQERTLAYAPILDLLRALIPAASPSTKARLGAGAAVIRTLLPGIRGLDAGDEGDESLEPELQRRQLFDGVLAAILGEASEFPALLLVEDVHWADQASLDWIAFLSRMTASNPLLLLLTYRSDDVSPGLAHLLATLDRERLAFEVELRPLGMGDVEAMVGATLGDASPLRADMLESLHRRSGGNPFLVEELLRSVTGGRPLEAGQVASASIPRSFDEALSARLAALSGEARELLNAAAVIGDRLDIDLLAAARRSTADELIPGLRELALQQLLVEDGDGWFRFRHALTRDAVLARLLSTERRREHARVAEALARVEGAASERAPELAYHRFEAGDWAAVVEPARIAGERARLAGAPAAAVAHFDRAVVAAEHSGHAPPDLLLGRAHAYDALGAFDEARADFEAAADAALAADDAHAQEEAALGLALLWSSRDYGRARGYTERAVEIARRIGNPAAVARALNRAANWYSNAGGYETSRSYLDEALEAARASGDERVLAETLDLLGMTCLVGARLDEGLASLEAAAIFTRLGDPRAASSPPSPPCRCLRGPTRPRCSLLVAFAGDSPGEEASSPRGVARALRRGVRAVAAGLRARATRLSTRGRFRSPARCRRSRNASATASGRSARCVLERLRWTSSTPTRPSELPARP
ncbi:MAG: BREX system ATP-binding domain-containing protein [Dehalococcoidia bacterium]